MKFKLLFVVISLLFSLVEVSGQRKKDDDMPAPFSGTMSYLLPKTSAEVTITVKETRFFKGPYSSYAKDMLGIANAPTSDYRDCSVVGVEISSFGEADMSKKYSVSGAYAAAMSLSEAGTLVGINLSSPIKDSCPSDIKSADFVSNSTVEIESWDKTQFYDYDSKVDGDSLVVDIFIVKGEEDVAKNVADAILKLRRAKIDALLLDVDDLFPDGKAYDIVFKEYDNLEKEYLELFIGKSYTQTHTYTFRAPLDLNGYAICNFSKSRGILPLSDSSGKPIALQLKREGSSVGGSVITGGVSYIVPGIGVARVVDTSTNRVLGELRLKVAQLGKVETLSADLLNGNYEIELFEETGGLKQIRKIK